MATGTEKAQSRRPTAWGTPFRPGVSGNPGGRPRNTIDVTMLARTYTRDAIEALARGLRDPKHYPACAIALLDRAYGKPLQQIHTQSESTVLHLIAAQALGQELAESVKAIVDTERPVIEASLDEQPKE